MLTREEIEDWDEGVAPPDPARPYIICPTGTGARARALSFDGDGSRVIVVARTRAHGEMTRKAGFEWADLRKPFAEQPMRCVVTLIGLPKLPGHPVEGDYLMAGDWPMLANRRTRIFKFFRRARRMRRFCMAAAMPHPWAAFNVMDALGNADKELRAIYEFHASRHLRTAPGGQEFLVEPYPEAACAIIDHFRKFTDQRNLL